MLFFACLVFAISSSVAGVSGMLNCRDVEALQNKLFVNDTANIGDVIHDFGTTFALEPNCHDFEANGTELLLNHTLRHPCTDEITLSCRVVCQSLGSNLLIVGINKLDIYLPSFPKAQYTANVTELSAAGTVVIEFGASDETKATDEDCSSIINYRIVESDGGNFIMSRPSDGIVATNGTVMYDTQTTYTLLVQAGDVKISNVIKELMSGGSGTNILGNTIMTLNGVQIPEQDVVLELDSSTTLYHLTDENKFAYMECNHTISWERVPYWINESGRFANTTLVISVLDSDNKNPAFTNSIYNLNITEEHVATEALTTSPPVLCHDQDVGINTTIQYAFKDMEITNSYFSINSTTGELQQTISMDREKTQTWRAEIMCYQADDPTQTATAYVEVTVLDVNDHLPVFAPEYLSMNVSVTEQSVGVIATVLATDEDEGDNAVIIYKLVQGDDAFTIDGNTGVISVKSPDLLDREKTMNLTILVRAEDTMGNFSSENASVLVNILDLNDNSPEFYREQYIFLFNVTGLNTVIGTVVAYDADISDTANSNVTYESIHTWTVGTAAAGPFPLSLDFDTGDISITNTVLPDVNYHMFVQACDNPVNENDRRCSSAPVLAVYSLNTTKTVHVSFNLTVPENVPLGTVIGRIPLTGNRYTISTTEFEVDQQSHMLKTNTSLDRETLDTYEFIVSVFSHTDLQVGNISVTLTVLDVNDHHPVFSQQEYLFHLRHQDSGEDIVLGTVESDDKDVGENKNRTYSLQSSPVSGWFTLDPQSGRLTLSQKWAEGGFRQTMFVLVAHVADHGTPSLQSTAQIFISTMEMVDNYSVMIYTDASASYIIQETERLQRDMTAILSVNHVTIEEITDVTSQLPNTRSSLHLKASYENGSAVSFGILARSVLENWYSVQDLFRTQWSGEVEHSDTALRVTEIALIVVAAAILLGALIAVPIVCRQWKSYVRDHRLYDTLRRPSTLYNSQELSMNFRAEETPRSHFSSFHNTPRKEEEPVVLDTSFGLAYVSPVFIDDDGNAPKTPTWGSCNQPRIPRWSTTDSLKDAMASLEDLSNRLNAEDSISAVTQLSRTRSMKSQNSFKDTGSEAVRDWDTVDTVETAVTAVVDDGTDAPDPDYPQEDTNDSHIEAHTSDRDRILMDNGHDSRISEKPVETHTVHASTTEYTIEQSTKF